MTLLKTVVLIAIFFLPMTNGAQAQSQKGSVGSPLTDQVKRGEGLFLQRCGPCHLSRIAPNPKLGKSYGPSLKGVLPETADSDQEASVRQFILKGTDRMPGFQYGLKTEEIDEIMAYLKTLSNAPSSSSPRAALSGTIRSDDGKPMEGVAVSARSREKTFTTTVFTDQKGGYAFPALVDGQYKIWAQAEGFDASQSEQDLAAGKNVQQDFILKTTQEISKQLGLDEWVASLPSSGNVDRRMKAIFMNNCAACHTGAFALQNRFDVQGWTAILNLMERTSPLGIIKDTTVNPTVHAYKEELIQYLARVRGPSSGPLEYKLVPRPTGEATQVVITEFDVPPGDRPDYFTDHNGAIWSDGVPSGRERSVHDMEVDANGIVWFTDPLNPERTLGRLDPSTGKITGYKLAGKDGYSVGTHGIAIGRDGNIWIANAAEGAFAQFNPRTEEFTRFPRPDSLPRPIVTTLAMDSKGNVWTTSTPGVTKLDPVTGQYTFYKAVSSGDTYGVTVDKDGRPWFTQPGTDRVGVIYPETGEASELVMPPVVGETINTKDRELAATITATPVDATPLAKMPRRLAADLNGNYVWVAETTADELARIDIRTKEVKEYPVLRPYTSPYATAVDKNHNVWIALMNADRIEKFDPSREKFTDYLLPTRGTEARWVAIDNSTDPPTVWVPYYRANKLARIQFRSGLNQRH